MLETLIAVWWGLLFFLILQNALQRTGRVEHPIIILLVPQIIAMFLIPLLATTGLVTAAVRMEMHHFLYLFCMSTLLIVSIGLGGMKWGGGPSEPSKVAGRYDSSVPFWICFGIGGIGTIQLLLGLGVSSPAAYIYMVTSDFNSLEDGFFNGSSAILWQANIAAFFWFSCVARPTLAMKIALGFCLIFVFSRGALLYIIIAAAYFFIAFLHLKTNRKSIFLPIVFAGAFLQMVFIFSYSFDGNPVEIYFAKTYPYLSGNFVNLFRHIDIAFDRSLLEIESFDDLLQSAGFSSVRVYIDRYFGIYFTPEARMIFYRQAEGAHIFGNTHSLYGQLVYLPLIVGIPFTIGLGLLIGRIYYLAPRNLFFLSIHAWFTAATFLSFAGAGHFNTTRFFPALLFIWPFLVLPVMNIRFTARRRQFVTKSHAVGE